jgi:hypothetical protein
MTVLVGVWMHSADDARIMRLAMEERLRSLPKNDPSRGVLEKWRSDAINVENRAQREGWDGWAPN